jgi:hypothetical protein
VYVIIIHKLKSSGWGQTGEKDRKTSNELLQAIVPYMPNEECQRRYTDGKKRVKINPAHLCAGGTTDNVDACKVKIETIKS